jgi:hypothetical protein
MNTPRVLTRDDVIDTWVDVVTRYKLNKDTSVIFSGGAMVLHGLREKTSDVDLHVSSLDFETMRKHGTVDIFTTPSHDKWQRITMAPHLEIVMIAPTWPPQYVSARHHASKGLYRIPVQTVASLLDFKLWLNRDKDQEDIRRLKERFYSV